MVSRNKGHVETLALLVHPNTAVLSALQHSFAARGVHSVVARDMASALLALGQHEFNIAVINQRIAVNEDGDGWALGCVMRRLFPDAHVAVICSEKDVASLQAAINNRLNQVFDAQTGAEDIADATVRSTDRPQLAMVQ